MNNITLGYGMPIGRGAAEPERWRSELFRLCMGEPPVGIVVFDRDMRYLAVNRRFREDLGLGDRELVGRSHYDVFPEIPPRWRDIHRRCLAGATERCEADPFRRANGTLEWYRWEIQPWYEASGVVGGVVLFSENISAQKHAESAREASEAAGRRSRDLLNSTLASMADVVAVFDADERLVYANAAARAKFGAHNLTLGSTDWRRVAALLTPDGSTPVPQAQAPLSRALRGENIDNEEFILRFRDPDAKQIAIIASARPIRDDAGGVTGAVLVVHDVTEIRATERQLWQSQKMDAIGQLTGGIAHDFNNILTVIMGTIEILTEGVSDRQTVLAAARVVDTAARRAATLTQQLLAFSRRQPLHPRETDVNALIAETARFMRPLLGEQIEIATMLGHDTWPAMVDPTQLSTALLNLALNARDAMPGGGKIRLTTSNVVIDEAFAKVNAMASPGPYVRVTVTDTGTGIPAAIRDKVFEPFFTTKEAGRGTGLGLSMVYGFIKQSRGHIEIDSREGHGTAISLYLPRSNVHDGETADTGEPVQSATLGGNETILVVEDDDLVRNNMLSHLRTFGYTPLPARNGEEALALVDAGADFALLLTDVVMPGGMNGRQLADEVTKRRPKVRILYTSGYAEDALVHDGRLDRGILLLNKPYHRAELARAVRQALGSRPPGEQSRTPDDSVNAGGDGTWPRRSVAP